MSIRWSEEDTKKIIELYKSYPFLWDSSNALYKNGEARNFAYNDIKIQVGKPNLSIRDLRCKIKNLRTAYYQELKRRIQAQKGGKPHMPGLAWFNDFHEIMEVIQVNKMTQLETEEEGTISDVDVGSNVTESNKARPAVSTYVVSLKQEFLDEMENKDVRHCPIVTEYIEPIETNEVVIKKKKKVAKRKEVKPNKNVINLDEYQVFANHMAEQLRNMPLDKALNLQVEVQALIAKERIDMNQNEDVDDGGSQIE